MARLARCEHWRASQATWMTRRMLSPPSGRSAERPDQSKHDDVRGGRRERTSARTTSPICATRLQTIYERGLNNYVLPTFRDVKLTEIDTRAVADC